MTGYGSGKFSVGETDFSLEISSVNQRVLAISVYAPAEWMPGAERLLTPIVRDAVSRGKITVSVRAGTAGATGADVFSWDEKAVANTLEKMAKAAREAGAKLKPDAAIYLRLAEIFRTRQVALPSLENENVAETLRTAAILAVKNFVEMRAREGANLEKDFRERVARLRAWTNEIREHASGTVAHARDALRTRLAALGVEFDLDDARVLKELALFADRCDISEELTRLESHFSQFESCLDEKDSGRKLDFICQEILREFNTIGSKANNAAITRCVVEAKNEQERLREQVQNVE